MKEKTSDIDILEELIRDYRDEKEILESLKGADNIE